MRKGFSLVEVVFSIIILGLIFVSVTKIMNLNYNFGIQEIKKEGIYHALRNVRNQMLKRFDEKTTDNDRNRLFILDVLHGDPRLNRISLVGIDKYFRIGSFKKKEGRIFYEDNVYTTEYNKLGKEAGEIEPDDFDDYNDIVEEINTKEKDFIFPSKITTKVFYVEDNANYDDQIVNFSILSSKKKNEDSNIKMSTTYVYNKKNNELVVTFFSFSCNIGSAYFLSKEFL